VSAVKISTHWHRWFVRSSLTSDSSCRTLVGKGTMEKRANIKFCFRLGKSATETFRIIQTVDGSEAMSRKNVFKSW
jgi:hypothetical protein